MDHKLLKAKPKIDSPDSCAFRSAPLQSAPFGSSSQSGTRLIVEALASKIRKYENFTAPPLSYLTCDRFMTTRWNVQILKITHETTHRGDEMIQDAFGLRATQHPR